MKSSCRSNLTAGLIIVKQFSHYFPHLLISAVIFAWMWTSSVLLFFPDWSTHLGCVCLSAFISCCLRNVITVWKAEQRKRKSSDLQTSALHSHTFGKCCPDCWSICRGVKGPQGLDPCGAESEPQQLRSWIQIISRSRVSEELFSCVGSGCSHQPEHASISGAWYQNLCVLNSPFSHH